MRKDMPKVVGENSRVGAGYTYRHFRARLSRTRSGDPDDLPQRLPMRLPYLKGWDVYCKQRNRNLGPLRRFFHSRVGRLWDDVWSELCAADRGSLPVLRGRADNFVEIDVYRRADGRLMRRGRFGFEWEVGPGDLYVDPDDGLLKEMPGERPSRHGWRDHEDPDRHEARGREYRRIGGVWYEIQEKAIVQPRGPYGFLGRAEEVVARKRTLGRRDLRRLGLENEPS